MMKKPTKKAKQKPTKKKEKQVKLYICPSCKSENVGFIFGLKNIFGMIPKMQCKSCSHSSSIFPQLVISKKKLEQLNKKARKKTKKK